MKKFLLPLALVLVISLSAGSVNAQERAQERMRPDNSDKGSEPMERVDCEVIQKRLDGRAEYYQLRRDHHLNWYEQIRARIAHLVEILEEKGYETSQIDALLVELEELIAVASDRHQLFMLKIQVAREFVCENPDAARKAYGEARAILTTFRADLANIKEFITGDLLPLIHDLKDQRPAVSAEEV